MADSTLKKLLVKFGVDVKDVDTAFNQIKSKLETMNKQAKAQHEAKLAQASKELAAEKQKADALVNTVKANEKVLNGLKTVIQHQNLSAEATEKVLVKAKNLTAENEHYLKILKLMPNAHDLDVSKMQQKLGITKEIVAWEERRIKAASGTAPGVIPSKTSLQAQTSAARVSQLESQLASTQMRGTLAVTQQEMQANAASYKSGEIQLKEYIAKQSALLKTAHAQKLALIKQEETAQINKVRTLEMLGKKVKAEADLEVRIIQEKNRQIAVSENSRLQQQLRGVAATPAAGGGLLGKVAGMAGFMMGGGLGVQMLAAVTAGNALYGVLGKVAEKMKEVLLGTSAEVQLREQFEKLTERAGEDPTVVLNKMKAATRGLVDEQQLFRVSNNFMQSGVKASSDQIAELTKYTVGLARAQGKDATQAMQAMVRASLTGRTAILAMVTGIDRQQLMLKGVGQAIDPVVRKNKEFANTLSVLKQRYSEIGEPQLTFKDRMERINIAVDEFYHHVAEAVNRSSGFQFLMSKLADTADRLVKNSTSLVESVADALSPAFAILASVLDTVGASLDAVFEISNLMLMPLKLMAQGVEEVIHFLFMGSEGTDSFVSSLFTLHGFIGRVAQVIVLFSSGLEQAALGAKAAGSIIMDVAKGDFAAAQGALNNYYADMNKLADDTYKKMTKLEAVIKGQKQSQKPAAGKTKTAPDPRAASALARAQLAYERAVAKEALEIAKERVEEEKELTDKQYKNGITTIQQFIDQRKAQERELFQARLAEFDAESKAKKKELEQELADGKVYGAVAAKRRQTMDVQLRTQREELERSLMKTLKSIDDQGEADLRSAHKKYLSEQQSLDKSEFDFRKKLTEQSFKDGVVSANEYLSARKAQIDEEYQFTINQAALQYQFAEKNAVSMAELQTAVAKAQQQREHDLTDLTEKELDTRLEAVKSRYQAAQQYLQGITGLVGTPQESSFFGTTNVQVVGLMQALNAQRLKNLQDSLADLNKESDSYLQDWMKVSGEINQAYQEQVKLNQEMAKAKDYLDPLSRIFGQMATTFGSLSKTLQEGLTRSASILESMSKYKTTLTPGMTGSPFKDAWTGVKGLFGKGPLAKQATQTLTPSGMMDKLVQSVGQAISKVDQFGNKIVTGAESATSNLGSTFQRIATTFDATVPPIKSLADAAAEAAAKLQKFAEAATGGASWQQQQTTGELPAGPFAGPGVFSPGTTVTGSAGVSTIVDRGPLAGETVAPGQVSFGQLQDIGIKGIADKFKKLNSAMGEGKSSIQEKLAGFANGLGGAMNIVGGVIGIITGSKTPGQGAMSGALQGFSTGAAFGPIGMAVGAIGGAAMGAIFGNKQQRVDEILRKSKETSDNIMHSLNMGATKLGDAINELKSLEAATLSQLNSSKKGRKQAPAAKAQFDQEINSLLEQQKKILDQLHESLALVMSPLPYQEFISSLDQIITKYKDFASAAAGNAEEMARANQFLVLSLEQYAQTEANQLNQAELSAVQNAIQLNDLLTQRSQMMAQYTTQVMDIMAQGNVVHQTTAAMKKAQQLQLLKTNYEREKENLDAQIAVAQDRYDKEKQIFDLATTRIDLETQLVALQEGQTTLDLQRVAALQDLVNKLQGMTPDQLANLQTLPALLASLGLGGVGASAMGVPASILQFLQSFQGPGGQFSQDEINALLTALQKGSIQQGRTTQLRLSAALGYSPDAQAMVQQIMNVIGSGKSGMNFLDQLMSAWTNASGPSSLFDPNTGLPLSSGGSPVSPSNPLPVTIVGGGAVNPPSVASGSTIAVAATRVASVAANAIDTGAARLGTESQIHSLAMDRAAVEMQVNRARATAASMDIAHVQALRSLLQDLKSASGGVLSANLESAFAQLYSVRGRYGAGGFSKEYL